MMTELNQLLQNRNFIRTVHQFGFLMIGYLFLNLVAANYSVVNTLVWMGIFFVIGLLIPLPEYAKLQDEDFS